MKTPRRTVLSGLAAWPTLARAQCRATPAAIVPLRAIDGFPILAASLDGAPVSLLLDTGAQAHLVLPEAAPRFRSLPGAVPMIGTGGTTQAPLVLLDGITFGAAKLDPAPTPVAPLPALPSVIPPLIGLVGAPLLDRFDLLLDVPGGRLGLYPAGACSGALPDIAPSATAVALTLTRDRQALLPVRIDGVEVIALLDTGSRATLLTVEAAQRLGLRAPASANTSRGVDGTVLPVGHLRVREMSVGDDVRREVPISISPVQLGGAELLLGLDFLRLRRVWISYVTARLVLALPTPAASTR